MLVKYNLAADWAARGFTLETAMALLATIGSLGGVAGGVLVSAWGGLRSKRVYGVVLSILISALLMIAMGYSAGLYLTAGIMFAINIFNPIDELAFAGDLANSDPAREAGTGFLCGA